MPGFKSFISSTSLRRIGAGISSRGSLAGFSSSFKISVRVISPMPSSSASFFLSLIFRSRLLTVTSVFSETAGAAFFFADFSSSSTTPPIAAASAFPIAVLVFRITISFCFFTGFSLTATAFLPAAFSAAAFFCASLTSAIVSPILSSNFSAAS